MKFVALLCILLCCVNAGADGKCRAMIFAGGGDKGSYQAAVLKTLIENLDPIETTWDVVTGVSAGTLNGGALAAFAPGNEKEFVEFVYKLWNEIEVKKVMKWWTEGIATGVLLKSSLFNNSPLKKLLTEQVGDKKIERHISIGTTDANNADFVQYKYSPGPMPADYIETLLASAAIPGIFPPVKRDGKLLIDGGCIWNSDITAAVNMCRDLGYGDKDIILDYVLCSGSTIEDGENNIIEDFHTVQHALRALTIN